MGKLVPLLVLLSLAAGLDCPKALCGQTQANADSCVEFVNDYMNFFPCSNVGDWVYTCDPGDLAASAQGSRATVLCSLDRFARKSNSTNLSNLSVLMNQTCLDKVNVDPGFSLASGTHPKTCTSDADCKMVNGAVTGCDCGTNALGLAYCGVHPYDPITLDMYDFACGSNLTYFYYQYLGWDYYPQTVGQVSCAAQVFNVLDAYNKGNNSLTTWYLTVSEAVSLLPILAALGSLSLI